MKFFLARFKFCLMCFFIFVCLVSCKEQYVVGIAPVYTEENRARAELSQVERMNIVSGYYEAVAHSKRYQKTIEPLALEVSELLYGFYRRDKFMRPEGSGLENVRIFYRDYIFKRVKDIRQFMCGNGINLLVVSYYTYLKHIKADGRPYNLTIEVYHRVQGSDQLGAVERYSELVYVRNFKDYQFLSMVSRDALAKLLDQVESKNPDNR